MKASASTREVQLFVTGYDESAERLQNSRRAKKWWSCKKDTREGDEILVFVKGTGICYEWEAVSNARPKKDWKFVCDVKPVRSIVPPISIQELRKIGPKWKALDVNFRGYRSIGIPENVVARLRNLLEDRFDSQDKAFMALSDAERAARLPQAQTEAKGIKSIMSNKTLKPSLRTGLTNVEFNKQKIARICYNHHGWRRPSGDAAKLEGPKSYVHKNGFGHEEWLFRSEWHVDGWRYGFLQAVNNGRKKLLEENRPFDIRLFTIQPDKQRRYVAKISDVECLSEERAGRALEIFKSNGWFGTMAHEIKKAGGKPEALGNSPEVHDILNVQYRLENVYFYAPDSLASPGDPIRKRHRYNLSNDSPDYKPSTPLNEWGGRREQESQSNEDLSMRKGTGPVTVTAEHGMIQNKLRKLLNAEYPAAKITSEGNYVDISVQTENELYTAS